MTSQQISTLSKLFILSIVLLSYAQCLVEDGSSKVTNIIFDDPNVPKPIGPYVVAKRVNSTAAFLYVSGQIGINPQTMTLPDTVEEQTVQALTNIKNILNDANSCLDDIVKATVYLIDMNDFDAVNAQYATFFPDGNYPTRVCIAVSALPKGAKIEIDIVAVDNS